MYLRQLLNLAVKKSLGVDVRPNDVSISNHWCHAPDCQELT